MCVESFGFLANSRMLSYLSKKIAVPHNLAVEVVSWNAGQGWLAIGGENGFLKVRSPTFWP